MPPTRRHLLAAAAAAPAGSAHAQPARTPAARTEFVFEAAVTVAAPLDLGDTGGGVRRVVPITGGRVTGPMLKGEVLPGGADWQVIRPDGVTEIEAKYTLRADDGALIMITNPGVRHGPPEVMRRLAAGEAVDPSLYYFRTTPRFETSSPKYGWLRRHVFVASGVRMPDLVRISVFRML